MPFTESDILQAIMLGAALADPKRRSRVAAADFANGRMRPVVEGITRQQPDSSYLEGFLKTLGCNWWASGEVKSLDAVLKAIRAEAMYERAMRAARETFPYFCRPKGTREDVIRHVRAILTPEQRKKYGLEDSPDA